MQLLKLANDSQRRTAATYACRFALREVSVPDVEIHQALDGISRGSGLPETARSALASIVKRLDGEYLDLHDKCEADPSLQEAMLAAFSRARAAAAVEFAAAEDSFVAATEAIYEASCAVADSAEMFEALVRDLDR